MLENIKYAYDTVVSKVRWRKRQTQTRAWDVSGGEVLMVRNG